jgi:hypothetical protein
MKTSLIAAIVAAAGLVAVVSPAEARCANGYEPVEIQGNWVCRVKTPKLPFKAKTQSKGARERLYPVIKGIEGEAEVRRGSRLRAK